MWAVQLPEVTLEAEGSATGEAENEEQKELVGFALFNCKVALKKYTILRRGETTCFFQIRTMIDLLREYSP